MAQRSVTFMFDLKLPSKIKNDKIQRWRLKVAFSDFTTICISGIYNCALNTLVYFRAISASTFLPTLDLLKGIMNSLCNPDITILAYYVKVKKSTVFHK